MNNIYYYQNADSAFEYIYAIYCNARNKDIHFCESNYEWRIGIQIINDILPRVDIAIKSDAPMELYGIEVMPDYKNPTRMELWKNITNE